MKCSENCVKRLPDIVSLELRQISDKKLTLVVVYMTFSKMLRDVYGHAINILVNL